jgi:hypothetical protein
MRRVISRNLLSIFAALVLFAALVGVSASARTAQSLVVNIPFNFTVAGKSLPAGQYIVERSTQSSADGLSLRNVDSGAGAFVLTSTVQSNWRQDASRLVFTRYNEQYFLSQYWTVGESSGRALIKSERERSLEGELAKTGAKPAKVTITIAQK